MTRRRRRLKQMTNQLSKSERTTPPMEPTNLMIRRRLGNGLLVCPPHSFKAVGREASRGTMEEVAREAFRGTAAVEVGTTVDSLAGDLAGTTGLSGLIMEEVEASAEVVVGALVVGLETIMEEEEADLTADTEEEAVASAGTRL
jgi:hypothetical protein